LRKISVPDNLDGLLHLAHLRWSLPSFVVSALPGGQRDFVRKGGEVQEAIQEAARDFFINKHKYLNEVSGF